MSNDWSDIFPDAWSGAEVLEGVDLVDKATLVGKPFLITGVEFTENANGVNFVYVTAEDIDGNAFQFNDSSTGVRQQIVHLLTKRGDGSDAIVENGGEFPMRLVAPSGLRVSVYDVQDTRTKQWKTARTYYLSTGGFKKSADDATAKKAPAKKATAKAATGATA